MGFFLLAGLFAATAGVSFMLDDDDDAVTPDRPNAPTPRNAGGGTVDDGGDDGDGDTPSDTSGPRGTDEGEDDRRPSDPGSTTGEDDVIKVRSGEEGFGGAGNDTLFSDDGGILTGGEGNDLFLVSLLDTTATLPTADTLTITDFDRDTDRIEVDLNNAPSAITLSDDGTDSTLTIDWQGPAAFFPTSTIIIKGVTGLTLQDFTFSTGIAYPKFADFPPEPGAGIFDSITQGSDADEQLTLTGDQPLAIMGAGNDSVTGSDGTGTGYIYLDDGDDSFRDGDGWAAVAGGAGNDSYISDGAEVDGRPDAWLTDRFYGGDGDDDATLLATPSNASPNLKVNPLRLEMGDGNDRVTIDRDFERYAMISDEAGDDTIRAWMGSDVFSGDGNDSLIFAIDEDHITAGRDDSTIHSLSQTDRLILDIDARLTGPVTTQVVVSNSDFGTSTWTHIFVGNDRVVTIWDQSLEIDDPRLTINRGVTFA